MRLIDIGANLTNKSFEHDLESVIQRSICAGVSPIIVTASSIRSAHDALALARTNPGTLFSTAGVHPHDAKSCGDETLTELRALHREPEVVAVGECGLDFNRNFSPQDLQEHWFAAQVGLACELAKPLFLHERDAHDRFISILDSFRGKLPRAVVHCFTGAKAELRAYLDRNFYIGITGWICDERRGRGLEELARYIPEDRLMIETDAPYLVPRTMRPKPKSSRNEPAFLTYVLESIAGSVGKSAEDVARSTFTNSMRFFGINEE